MSWLKTRNSAPFSLAMSHRFKIVSFRARRAAVSVEHALSYSLAAKACTQSEKAQEGLSIILDGSVN